MSIDGSQRQPRDGGKKKSPGDAQKPRERIFLSGKFEIPDRGRNYGGEEGREGEEYEDAALSNTFPTSSTRFSRARFNSLEGVRRREMIFLKRVGRGFVQPQTAYHQLDFMGHLRYDTIQPL